MHGTQRAIGIIALAVYLISIIGANWLIHTVGIAVPGGNHLIPVGFGLMAPSGTLAAGITYVARDVVQRTIGRRWSLLIIPIGVAITALLNVQLALASGAAFAFSELVDYAVYTPLQARGLVRAVFASAIVASITDSFIFLTLAGIPLGAALPGLLLGKLYITAAAIPVIAWLRRVLVTQGQAVPA